MTKENILPKVFIVTLNWNGMFHTIECIESIKKLEYTNYGIIVVDNNSTDGSINLFRELFDDTIKIIINDRNLGYSEGFNTGIKYAFENGADYILILNNDVKIDPKALSELMTAAQKNPDAGFLTGKTYFYNSPNTFQTAGKSNHSTLLVGHNIGSCELDEGQYDCIKEYDFVDDVFLLVNREVIEKVGMYNKNFFLHYEIADWCARVRSAGFRILYVPKAKIWHKGGMSDGGSSNASRTYYMARNRIVFLKRNASLKKFYKAVIYILLVKTPVTLFQFFKGYLKRHLKHSFAYLKGTLHGIIWSIKSR